MSALLLLLALLPASDKADKPDIPALVRQLGSDKYKARVAAQEALGKLGVKALPELRKALGSPDLEVRMRVRRLLTAIANEAYGLRQTFTGHSVAVNAVAFAPDGKRAAAGDSRGIRVWDLASGKQVASSEEHRDRVMALAYSPDGKVLASGSEDRTVGLWQADKLAAPRFCKGHRRAVRAVAFAGTGKTLVSAGMDGRLIDWDVASGKWLRELRDPSAEYLSLCLVGGDQVVTTTRMSVLVDIRSWKKKARLKTLPADAPEDGKQRRTERDRSARSVAVDRTGARVVVGMADGEVRVYDSRAGKLLHILRGHREAVTCVAVSPDGSQALSGSLDKTLRIWDLKSGEAIRELKGHTAAIWAVAYSRDGKRAVSGGQDATMRLWAVGH